MAQNFGLVGSLITHANAPVFDGAVHMTWCFWIRLINALVGAEYSMSRFSSTTLGWAIGNTTGSGVDTFGLGNNAATIRGLTSLVTGDGWTHFAIVYDGTGANNAAKLKIYKNGVSQTLTFSGTIWTALTTTTGSPAFQTGRNGASRNAVRSDLALIAVFSETFTLAQVLQQMQSRRPIKTGTLELWPPYDDGAVGADYSQKGIGATTLTSVSQVAGPPVNFGAGLRVL